MISRMWLKVGIVAGVAAAGLGVTGLVFRIAGKDSEAPKCTVTSDGEKVVVCDFSRVVDDVEQRGEIEVLAISKAYEHVAPKGSGPWPFSVVGTGNLGLKVWSTNLEDSVQLGALAHLSVIWAVCMEDSGWDPLPATGNGATWLKIKWDATHPNTGFHNSNFSARSTGWAYEGYLVPVGHNGDIPACD